MLAMIYAVFLTASRGGTIALVGAALVCLWQLGVKGRRFYLVLLVPVAMIVIWLYGGKALRERFEQTSTGPVANSLSSVASASAAQRKELLLQSLKVTAQHPVFGVGPGNFVVVSGVWHATHNSYTEMSAEGGVPALFLYVFILWRCIANLRDLSRYPRTAAEIRLFSMAVGASITAYLIGSFFASDAYQVFPYCFVIYSRVLRLIVKRDLTHSSWVPESKMVPTQAETTVWQ